MTYNEFMAGLYVVYHTVYVRSVAFIKFSKAKGDTSAKFENPIALMVGALVVLHRIKNRNMAEALCLMAQGYMQWEIGEMLNVSERTIQSYTRRVERYLY